MQNIIGLEGKILKKYVNAKFVDPEDEYYLEMMASTGLIRYGYDLKKDIKTAKTTLLGRSSID